MNEPNPAPNPIPTEPTPTPDAWLSSVADEAIRGAAQTKGWDKLSPVQAFEQAAKAHREVERFVGVPQDQLIRIPKVDDAEGWKNVWQRLGAPAKAEEYNLEGLDFDDAEMTSRFQQAIRQTASELGMPKAHAERLAATMHKVVADTGDAAEAEKSAYIQDERNKLFQDWGKPDEPRYKANEFIARQATEKLGLDARTLDRIGDALAAGGVGYADAMKMFHKIGIGMGEDKYVAGSNPSNNGLMSRDQAIARRGELMADKQWTDRYMKGGSQEMREMTALNTLIAG